MRIPHKILKAAWLAGAEARSKFVKNDMIFTDFPRTSLEAWNLRPEGNLAGIKAAAKVILAWAQQR